MARLRAGDAGMLFVTARHQTGGRGRSGRQWASPAGNLYASLALRDPGPLACVPQLGLVAGVALARALKGRLGGNASLQLKWPNDVLFAGAKLAGILLESAGLPGGGLGCVVGMGVNCISHPAGLSYPATDLRAVGDPNPDPEAVLAEVAREFRDVLDLWDGGLGFAAVRRAWLGLAAGIGEPISVRLPTGLREGIFRGLDEAGHLLLETAHDLTTVLAGDVFLSVPA